MTVSVTRLNPMHAKCSARTDLARAFIGMCAESIRVIDIVRAKVVCAGLQAGTVQTIA